MELSVNPARLDAIPHRLLTRARAAYGTMKSAERRAMDYLVDFPDQVAGASIVTVASHAGCSEATLVRLAKKLGYEGFPALRAELARGGEQDVVYRGITPGDNPRAVVDKVFAASIQSLRDTLSVLDTAEYERAVAALLGSRRILVCGLGDAAQVAAAITQKFIRVDVDARTSEDPDVQLIQASHLRTADVAIGISHSGRTTTVMHTLREAHERGATTIAITNYPHAPLAKQADIVLLTADFAEHLNGEVVSKRVSEQCLLESLYIAYLIQRNGGLRQAQERANSAVEAYKA